MTNVICMAGFLKQRTERQMEIVAFFNDQPTLAGKLQAVANKMCVELADVHNVPPGIVRENEQLMQYIATTHHDELDNGYSSVCEIIEDLVCYQQECCDEDTSVDYISVS